MGQNKKFPIFVLLLLIFPFFNIYAQALFFDVICNFAFWVRGVLVTIGILSLMFAGYKILTSGGDPGRMEEAKKVIVAILVGMAFIWVVGSFTWTVGLPRICPQVLP